MKQIINEIGFRIYELRLKIRESWFKLIGVDRNFYCQRECEEESKCKYECGHCHEYYKPLNRNFY